MGTDVPLASAGLSGPVVSWRSLSSPGVAKYYSHTVPRAARQWPGRASDCSNPLNAVIRRGVPPAAAALYVAALHRADAPSRRLTPWRSHDAKGRSLAPARRSSRCRAMAWASGGAGWPSLSS